MATDSITKISLDDYFQSTNIGSIDKAIGNNLYGINHRQIAGMVPSNKDTYGLTFFVRPQLNLQGDNIRNVRKFYPLLAENPLTIHRYVRATLDPRIMHGYSFGEHTVPPITCQMVDNLNAFIPILTNNLNTLTGWPDLVTPMFQSKPGLYNEAYGQVDGITEYYEAFDIDATFRNTRGDPILYMFYIWQHYTSLVFEGKLIPYIDFITENEIDYNTRIYRLVLDQNKEIVKKIAATGAAVPISNSIGSFFDFNNDKPYNDQNKDITIKFRCFGAQYQDDILISEFNKTVIIFNSNMADSARNREMVRVDKNTIQMFNNRGYPRINPNNYTLEWWVPKDLYNARTKAFIAANIADKERIDNYDRGD